MPIQPGSRQQPLPMQPGQLDCQLQDAGPEDPPSQRVHRLLEPRREPQHGRNQRQVEQRRRDRGQGEASERIEHAPRHGGQRNKQDVRKSDAKQVPGDIGARVAVHREARRKNHDQQGCREDAERGDENQHCRQCTGRGIDEGIDLLRFLFAVFHKHRHERLRKRTFGGQATQEIRDAERDEKCIQRTVRVADEDEHHRIAGIAQQAGKRSHKRRGGQGAKEPDHGKGGQTAQVESNYYMEHRLKSRGIGDPAPVLTPRRGGSPCHGP